MENFIEKWQNDKKYRAKMKLLLYLVFIIAVSIYAVSLNKNNYELTNQDDYKQKDNIQNDIIEIPETYTYDTVVNINDSTYKFTGTKDKEKESITKEVDDEINNFIVQNNEYYKEENGIYIKTSKESIYEPVNYDYININNINLFLKNAKKNNNEYLVYVKDIILGNTSNEYFVISVNENYIYIDYTPLVKQLNNSIYKYTVSIKIIEE